jgi:polysaccharide chain length determinant protein (PEP-CTERM system associated)
MAGDGRAPRRTASARDRRSGAGGARVIRTSVHEFYEQALHILNAVWHRRWAALGAAWLVALLGWALVVAQPNTYTSRARIFIDATSIMDPVLEGLAIDWDLNLDSEVMRQTLTTRGNLERVARMTDLDLMATTPAEMENLLNSLRSRTLVENESPHLLRLSFTDADPARAQAVTQALTETFLDSNLGRSREKIEDAQEFLDEQIAYYERELDAAEQRLATFRQERLSTLPDQENYRFQMEQLRDELIEAEAGLASAEARQVRLRRELEAGPASDVGLQVFETERQLAQLLGSYTERHPDVIALRRKLAHLRGEPDPTLAGGAAAAAAFDGARSRAGLSLGDYEQIKSQLAEADAQAALYAGRADSLRARLARMEERAADVPAVEVELAKLTRDYEVLKIKHGELLARREQAKLAHDSEVGADRVKYQIVEAPRVPMTPDGPSRSVLITLVLLVALAAGASFAFVLVHVNECFADPRQLRRAFNLPVLGTVSAVQSPGQRTWRLAEVSSFAGGCALLAAAYGIILLAETQVGWSNLVPAEVTSAFHEAVRS